MTDDKNCDGFDGIILIYIWRAEQKSM